MRARQTGPPALPREDAFARAHARAGTRFCLVVIVRLRVRLRRAGHTQEVDGTGSRDKLATPPSVQAPRQQSATAKQRFLLELTSKAAEIESLSLARPKSSLQFSRPSMQLQAPA